MAVFLVAAVVVVVPLMSAQQIAITWDDLPAHGPLPPGTTRLEIIQKIIKGMKDAGLPPAYGFVNGVRLKQESGTAGVLKAWRAAGLPLGSHTYTHMNLTHHTVAEFEQDTEENEPILRKEMGSADWHWFRFPYLAEGETPEKRAAARAFLAQKGYRIAAVTMGFGDHMWNPPYARCVAKNDQAAIEQLEATYLQAAAEDADYRRALAKAAYGHDVPYVLLMHVGALDAKLLPRLLAMYKQKGFQFISLQEAEQNRFYKVDVDLSADGPPPSPSTMAHDAGSRAPHSPKHPDIKNLCN